MVSTKEKGATRRGKLQVFWKGPYRVIATVSEMVYSVEHLINHDVSDVHANWLKFYDDSSLAVTEELIQHIAQSESGWEVEELLDIRFDNISR